MLMSGHNGKGRPIWTDRFRVPDADHLIASLPRQLAAVVEHARQSLIAADGATEEVVWQGVWRWTFVYRSDGEHRGWAYLVPDPHKPRLAFPFPDGMIAELPLKKLSKFIRDGLAHAPVIDGVRWSQWELQYKAQVDDLMSLAEHRLSAMKASK